MKKYNALIIGCGKQGCGVGQEKNPNKIINFAHALSEHGGFGNIEFFDKDIDKAVKAEIEWNSPNSGPIDYLRNNCVDVAIVAVPDNKHYGVLKQLALYSLKLVICEKPICENLEQAREIVELYKARGIPLMVDNTRNFIPVLRDLTKEHGKAISGFCLFNRGWLHSAIHAIGFFRMLNLANYRIKEVKELDSRVWILNVCFEDGYIWSEERITNDMPVPSYYDLHLKYVIDNAYDFLEGNNDLIYTGEMALNDTETCYELMDG
jgi:hypothetical protein